MVRESCGFSLVRKGAGRHAKHPQSLLWISPRGALAICAGAHVLISKRDAVRRTSDVALAPRPEQQREFPFTEAHRAASGHQHDPNWKPSAEDHDDEDHEPRTPGTRSVVIAAVAEQAEPDYLDVDIVDEDSGALPVGAGMKADVGSAEQPSLFDEARTGPGGGPERRTPAAPRWTPRRTSTRSWRTTNTSMSTTPQAWKPKKKPRATVSTGANRSRRMESSTAAAVSARKYQFRRRALMSMAAVMVLTAVLSFTVSSDIWWVCGSAAV